MNIRTRCSNHAQTARYNTLREIQFRYGKPRPVYVESSCSFRAIVRIYRAKIPCHYNRSTNVGTRRMLRRPNVKAAVRVQWHYIVLPSHLGKRNGVVKHKEVDISCTLSPRAPQLSMAYSIRATKPVPCFFLGGTTACLSKTSLSRMSLACECQLGAPDSRLLRCNVKDQS